MAIGWRKSELKKAQELMLTPGTNAEKNEVLVAKEGAQLVTHTVGALLYFIGIEVYFFAQLVMAYMLRPRMTSIHLTNSRLILALTAIAVLAFHITCLFASPFVKEIDGKKPTESVPASGIVRHKKGDPFYSNWLATTVSEWVLAFLILLHVLTYCYDFAMVKIPSLEDLHASCIKHEKANWSDEPSEQVRAWPSTSRLHVFI
ncbi:hypothetical protein Y032_0167g144 [Ancylostoma ceylanicum]|uniref:CWH43-like N-terminal domain-containing protein n=1 Tax=Ancylostoma ceylanicum TaxID=53326 RepID=A0A016SWQ6_9BILA|nr:hypothetical protein Y032_0167g144 [Ancylostoma ceylanicum]